MWYPNNTIKFISRASFINLFSIKQTYKPKENITNQMGDEKNEMV